VWWIDAVREREIFSNVTLTNSPSIFKDVTTNHEEFLGSLKHLELANLMECCDKHLHATVRCPWGCTEYLHKAESLALDIVFARYLGVALVTDCARGEVVVMQSACDDFDSWKDVTYILMNPIWRIVPSVAFFRMESHGCCCVEITKVAVSWIMFICQDTPGVCCQMLWLTNFPTRLLCHKQ
jgi:hypothetical protein